MAQQTAWGGKKIVLAVVGVAAAIVMLLVATAAVGLVWATSTAERLGEPAPEPVASTVATRDAGVRAAAAAHAGQPLRVEIELQEGEFEVRPGPPDTGVQVDGAYAKAYYELTEEHTPADEPGGPATVVRLRPSQSFVVRLVGSVFGDHEHAHNALTVTIPRDVPVDLRLRLRMGETRTDLGGLMLTDLDAALTMGEHRLDFSEPLAGRPDRVRVVGEMGEIRLERFGNAGPRELDVEGRMGSLTVDLGGDWLPGAVADVTLDGAMGEFRLDVPNTVRIASDSNVSNVFGATSRPSAEDDASPDAPLVRLHLSNTMGETRVSRY